MPVERYNRNPRTRNRETAAAMSHTFPLLRRTSCSLLGSTTASFSNCLDSTSMPVASKPFPFLHHQLLFSLFMMLLFRGTGSVDTSHYNVTLAFQILRIR